MKVALPITGDARPRRKTGRPLSFDRAQALEQAMLTFWHHGYEGSSIADLTTAMGINPPSLYAAFGDKQRLFLESMRLYAGDPQDIALAIDAASTAYDAASDLLRTSAAAFTGESTPKGCLITSATASGSTATTDVQRAAAKIRDDTKAALCARIKRDIEIGILPTSIDAAALAGLVMAVVLGMSGLARDGADRTVLMAIAATALDAWPLHLQTVAPQGDASATSSQCSRITSTRTCLPKSGST